MLLHFCLQTNKQCCRMLGLTNHSSVFQPVFGPKLNMIRPSQLATDFWHQKSMTDWPVSGTSQLVPETGAWNWSVCHHYKVITKQKDAKQYKYQYYMTNWYRC